MKRKLFLVFMLLVCIVFSGCNFQPFFQAHIGTSYQNNAYYTSDDFRITSIAVWEELKNYGFDIFWLSQKAETNQYYMNTSYGQISIIPSDNIAILFNNGALGLQFYSDTLIITDYLSFSEEAGCILSLSSGLVNDNVCFYWEQSGITAYSYKRCR